MTAESSPTHEAGIPWRELTIFGDGSPTLSFFDVSHEIEGILRLSKLNEHLARIYRESVEFPILEVRQSCPDGTRSKTRSLSGRYPKTI
jgi:hypothetical protein